MGGVAVVDGWVTGENWVAWVRWLWLPCGILCDMELHCSIELSNCMVTK